MDSEKEFRAFLGIPLAEAFEVSVRPILQKLKREYPEVKWVKPSQLHLTLHFFGQIEAEAVTKISDCTLPVAEKTKPLKLFLKGIGGFPNLERPRVIWAGIEGEVEALGELQASLEHRFRRAGFPCEERSFKPHLTLGRVREGKRVFFTEHPELDETERKQISEIILYWSVLSSEGPIYEKLQTYPLAAT